jgi:hypothetical protein
MKDLYRCLDDCAPALLSAIAEAWRIPLAKREPLEMVRALGDAMLSPDALQQALSSLSSEALDALAELAHQGGEAPAQRLALRYGAIRRLGPARLAREQPWLQPANAVEELYYRGLLFRAYGALGDYYGDLLIIPEQLFQRLPPLPVQPAEWEHPLGSPPPCIRSSDRDLMEDLFAALVRLRQAPLLRSALGEGASPFEQVVETLIHSGRLLGPRDLARHAMMWAILIRLDLVKQEGDSVQPSLRARDWLRQSDESRRRGIYFAWRDDPAIDELRLLPTLRCEGRSPASRPTSARRHVMAILSRFPEGQWFAIDALGQALKRRRPDFLRVDRDPGWTIRDAQTGAYLDGPESWERVEGALIRYLLTTTIHWLGIVNLGSAPDSEEPTAFNVTSLGKRLLALPEHAARSERASHAKAVATVDEELVVRISTENSLYERYQMERFCEWRGQDKGEARYQITEDSLWHSHDAAIRIEQILGFMRRITQNRVPPLAQRTLQAWGGRFGRATLERMVVLQTTDAPTMALIREDPQAAALLGPMLAPTACQVAEERVEALVARLKAIDIWPRIRLMG